ncbi:MAG: hypothetical protein B7Y02_13625 [Rhodobacterales bacterium 17-64-5]|nr:MAG: hypothetical protein B7Y02_13625 [Rhodobacterales bacterium 17-64-5]
MKLYASLLALIIAVPAFAQTETTDPAKNSDTAPAGAPDSTLDELSNRTGTVFFSDEAMTTMRSGDEIEAQWSTLSVEDQDAIRARCDEMTAAAGTDTTTGGGTTMQNDTAATGTDTGTDTGVATGTGTDAGATSMAYLSDDTRMAPICDMISTY